MGDDLMIEPIRRRRGRGMPADELHESYPSLRSLTQPSGQNAQAAWVAVFNARPDSMASLLADLIKQVHAQPKRIGQRPMPREEEVDFQSLVFGEQNDLPLHEALPKLMTVGQREFARRANISRGRLERILAGAYQPDVNELRLLAKAGRKTPMYFIEYRKTMAVAAFVNLIDERPGLATTLYKRYLEVRMGQQP